MTISMERIISHAVLVPIGNGSPMSGPEDPDCIMGLPVCWWGLPAVGKSARIKAGGAAAGLPTRVILPSHRAPEDFGGVPIQDKEGKLQLACILGAVRELLALPAHPDFGQRGLLFIDEVTWARPATQGALLGAVQDRLFGDTALPPGIRIMLAANPPAVAGGGWELNPPLASRMAHLTLAPPTADEWVNWLMGRSGRDIIDLEHGELLLRYHWPDVFARAKGVMAGFMRSVGAQHIHNLPPVGHEDRGRAWPQPRGWDMATRALATCLALDMSTDKTALNVTVDGEELKGEGEDGEEKKKKKEVKTIQTTAANQMAHIMIEAIVGQAAAGDWVTWLADADLPTPEDVLDKGWTIDHQRVDRTVAVLESVTSYVLGQKDDKEKERRAAQLWPFLGRLAKGQLGDIAWGAAEDLSRCTPKLDSTNPNLASVAAQPTMDLGRGIARVV